MHRFLILTVEPLSNKKGDYRLGLSTADLLFLLENSNLVQEVEIFLGQKVPILISAKAISVYRRWGKIVNPKISEWIVANHLNVNENRAPTKLIFELKIKQHKHFYKLYANQMNLTLKK